MTSDVSGGGQPAVSLTDQPVIIMATEGSQDSRQSQNHFAGRFALESDHVALKNNSECVVILLCNTCLYCVMADFAMGLPCIHLLKF